MKDLRIDKQHAEGNADKRFNTALPTVERTVKDFSKEIKEHVDDDGFLSSSWTVQRTVKDSSKEISPSNNNKDEDDELLNSAWEEFQKKDPVSAAPIVVHPKSPSKSASTDELVEKILNVRSLTQQVASRRRLRSAGTATTVNKPAEMDNDAPSEQRIRVKDVDQALTKQFLAVHSERLRQEEEFVFSVHQYEMLALMEEPGSAERQELDDRIETMRAENEVSQAEFNEMLWRLGDNQPIPFEISMTKNKQKQKPQHQSSVPSLSREKEREESVSGLQSTSFAQDLRTSVRRLRAEKEQLTLAYRRMSRKATGLKERMSKFEAEYCRVQQELTANRRELEANQQQNQQVVKKLQEKLEMSTSRIKDLEKETPLETPDQCSIEKSQFFLSQTVLPQQAQVRLEESFALLKSLRITRKALESKIGRKGLQSVEGGHEEIEKINSISALITKLEDHNQELARDYIATLKHKHEVNSKTIKEQAMLLEKQASEQKEMEARLMGKLHGLRDEMKQSQSQIKGLENEKKELRQQCAAYLEKVAELQVVVQAQDELFLKMIEATDAERQMLLLNDRDARIADELSVLKGKVTEASSTIQELRIEKEGIERLNLERSVGQNEQLQLVQCMLDTLLEVLQEKDTELLELEKQRDLKDETIERLSLQRMGASIAHKTTISRLRTEKVELDEANLMLKAQIDSLKEEVSLQRDMVLEGKKNLKCLEKTQEHDKTVSHNEILKLTQAVSVSREALKQQQVENDALAALNTMLNDTVASLEGEMLDQKMMSEAAIDSASRRAQQSSKKVHELNGVIGDCTDKLKTQKQKLDTTQAELRTREIEANSAKEDLSVAREALKQLQSDNNALSALAQQSSKEVDELNGIIHDCTAKRKKFSVMCTPSIQQKRELEAFREKKHYKEEEAHKAEKAEYLVKDLMNLFGNATVANG